MERKDVFFSRPKKPLTLKGLIRALRKFTQSWEKIKQAIYLKFDQLWASQLRHKQ